MEYHYPEYSIYGSDPFGRKKTAPRPSRVLRIASSVVRNRPSNGQLIRDGSVGDPNSRSNPNQRRGSSRVIGKTVLFQ